MGETSETGPGPRGPARPLPAEAAPFDAIGLARTLLRGIRSGALATLDPDGTPFASLVTIATDVDGTPLMLLSRLSAHTRNLLANPRCSLLFSQGGKGDPLAHPRLTVVGRAVQTAETAGAGAVPRPPSQGEALRRLPGFRLLRPRSARRATSTAASPRPRP